MAAARTAAKEADDRRLATHTARSGAQSAAGTAAAAALAARAAADAAEGTLRRRAALPGLAEADYRASLPAGAGVPLNRSPAPTFWDPALQPAMQGDGWAVHEEAVLPILLADLAAGSG